MHQGIHKVVFDTNVVISAAISREGTPAKVFELLLEKKIINYTTKEIINEIEEVMGRPVFRKCIDKKYRNFVLDNFKRNSVIIRPIFDDRVIAEDKNDDKFINCARSAKADIISGDKHLLQLGSYKGINIFDVRSFLMRKKG